MQDSRHTRQQELILSCLKQNSYKHMTIQEIEEFLNKNDTHVGTATIYRCLNKLLQMNIVRKFNLDGQNSSCYQYIKDHDICCEHFHMICSKCSKTTHFQNESLIKMFTEVNKNNPFKIDLPKTIFYGICEKCLTK